MCSMCSDCRMSQICDNSSPLQRDFFLCRSWAIWPTSLNLGTFYVIYFCALLLCSGNCVLCFYSCCFVLLFLFITLSRNPNRPLSVSGVSFSELLPPWPQFLPHPNGQNYKELSPTLNNHKSLQANQCSFWSQYVPVLNSSTGQWLCTVCELYRVWRLCLKYQQGTWHPVRLRS